MQKCHYDVSSKVCKQTKLLYRTYPHIKQIITAKWMESSTAEQSIFKGGVVGFISLRFNGHLSRWTWVSRCLLKQRMMEVVVTTGAIRRAKLQSNHHHQQTNTQLFLQALPVAQPTVSQHWREVSQSMDLLTPSSPGGLPTLSLTTIVRFDEHKTVVTWHQWRVSGHGSAVSICFLSQMLSSLEAYFPMIEMKVPLISIIGK